MNKDLIDPAYDRLVAQRKLTDLMAGDVKAIPSDIAHEQSQQMLDQRVKLLGKNAEELSTLAPLAAFEHLKKAFHALKKNEPQKRSVMVSSLKLTEAAGIVDEVAGMQIAQFVVSHTEPHDPLSLQAVNDWSSLMGKAQAAGSYKAAFDAAIDAASERALAPAAGAAIVTNFAKLDEAEQEKAAGKLIKLAGSVRGAPYPAITIACEKIGRDYSYHQLQQIVRRSKPEADKGTPGS